MAIGILNYPELDWKLVTGEEHTVPVGFGPCGEPIVVMDILCFRELSADQSIAFASTAHERTECNFAKITFLAEFASTVAAELKRRHSRPQPRTPDKPVLPRRKSQARAA